MQVDKKVVCPEVVISFVFHVLVCVMYVVDAGETVKL